MLTSPIKVLIKINIRPAIKHCTLHVMRCASLRDYMHKNLQNYLLKAGFDDFRIYKNAHIPISLVSFEPQLY